jgi:hypothetical protein
MIVASHTAKSAATLATAASVIFRIARNAAQWNFVTTSAQKMVCDQHFDYCEDCDALTCSHCVHVCTDRFR